MTNLLKSIRHLEKLASPMWSESKTWSLIEEIGWGTKTTDYKAVKKKLMSEYTLEEMQGFREKVNYFYNRVSDAVDKYVHDLRDEGGDHDLPYGGDDSYSDMCNHVVGMGKSYYEKVIKEPSILETLKPKESFSYCIPSEYDYKKSMSSGDVLNHGLKKMREKIDFVKNLAGSKEFGAEFDKLESTLKKLEKQPHTTYGEIAKELNKTCLSMKDEIEPKLKDLESLSRNLQALGSLLQDEVLDAANEQAKRKK